MRELLIRIALLVLLGVVAGQLGDVIAGLTYSARNTDLERIDR